MSSLISQMDRDRRLDSLRGLLLVVMTIDHLGGPLSTYTHESLGFVSALEGFLFLSGFICAAVYLSSPDYRTQSVRIVRRAWTIYRWQMALVLLLPLLTAFAAQRHGLTDWVQPYLTDPVTYFGLALIGLHQPVYMDILPKYVLLLLVSPLPLIALQRGFGALVLLASALAWMAVQVYGGSPSLVANLCAGCRQGPEEMGAWQLIWVAGMYCGYRYRDERPIVPDRLALAASMTVATLLFLVRHAIVRVPVDPAGISQAALGWVRVVNVMALGLVLGWALQHVPRQRGLAWFELLGRSSLQVFVFQVVLVYLVFPFHEQLQHAIGTPGVVLINLMLVGTLTLPALAGERYRCGRSRSIGQLQPA